MKFIVTHPLPKGLSRTDLETMIKSIRQDPEVRGYRSFLSLSEGKGFCVFEAPDRTCLENWLTNNNLHYDSITEIELEGYRGEWVEIEKLTRVEV
jgi:hypothetical protein